MEDMNKRQVRFKQARKNFLISVCLLVIMIVLYNIDIGGIVFAIFDVAFVVFLIIGIYHLIGGFRAKGS